MLPGSRTEGEVFAIPQCSLAQGDVEGFLHELRGFHEAFEVGEHFCAQRGELRLFVLELTHDRRAKLGHALGEDNPILAQEPADLNH